MAVLGRRRLSWRRRRRCEGRQGLAAEGERLKRERSWSWGVVARVVAVGAVGGLRMPDETSGSRRRGSTVVHVRRSRSVSVGSSLRLKLRRRAVGVVGRVRSTVAVGRVPSSSSLVRRVPRSTRRRWSRHPFSSSLSTIVVVVDWHRAHRQSSSVLLPFPSSVVLVLLVLAPFLILVFFFLVFFLLILILLVLLIAPHRLVILIDVLLLLLLLLLLAVALILSVETSVGRRDVVASEESCWKVQDPRIRFRMESFRSSDPSRLLLLDDPRSSGLSSSSESRSLRQSRSRSFERSFSSIRSFVRLDVLSEVVASTETLPASTASVGLLHGVSSDVSFEVFESFEELAAGEERTGERSTSSWFGGRDGLDSMSDGGSLDRWLRGGGGRGGNGTC